jgi:predicted deacylase
MEKRIRGAFVLLIALIISAITAMEFLSNRKPFDIKKGPGVTDIRKLSDYFQEIRETRGDTEVYFLGGEKPGGTALILGGTHPNEPAGHVTAIVVIERAKVDAGRIIVLPRANASGFTSTDPQEASPNRFSIDSPSGTRWFRFGSRSTSPMDQWPDPDIYLHYPSGQTLSGNQTRNLNRAFPGKKDGNYTERVAYAITELVKKEKVNLVIDLHEASPEYPVINAVVAHERAMSLASMVVMNLEMRGIKIGLEPSPGNLHGLTHRELGDHTQALAVLMETTNPSQGRLRGRTSPDLVLSGKDKMYVKANGMKRLYVEFDEKGYPLSQRVGRHLAGIEEFLKAYSEANPSGPIVVQDFPPAEEVLTGGIGKFLN